MTFTVGRSTRRTAGSPRGTDRARVRRPDSTSLPAFEQDVARLRPEQVLTLQRLAGNRAVAAAITGRPGSPLLTVQRHSSFEHAMMSNTKPSDAEVTAGKADPANRRHVLEAERDRALFFKDDPAKRPDESAYPFQGVQLIQLTGSKLWVTAGEISAMADYLPNGEEINRLSANQLQKILQFMRNEIATNCADVLKTGKVNPDDTADASGFKGAQVEEGTHPLINQSNAAKKILTEDQATSVEGSQSYSGLLTRNACHFAPMSWERYTLHHDRAVGLARQAWQKGAMAADSSNTKGISSSLVEEQTELRTQALVDSNYSNHFLQDSFAAGHLTNKTLVMQWFLEWCQTKGYLGRTTAGLPNNDLGMSEKAQPGIAGQALYHQMDASGSVLKDNTPVELDPQTASERGKGGWEGRAEAIGVDVPAQGGKETVHDYWEMLRTTALNYVTGKPHDEFNLSGLTVKNRRGDTMFVGGDDSQDQIADPKGFEVPIEATNKSAHAIDATLATGNPSASAEDCLAMVPTIVVGPGGDKPLLEWNDNVLRQECEKTLFPQIWGSTQFKELRILLSTHADTTATRDWKDTD